MSWRRNRRAERVVADFVDWQQAAIAELGEERVMHDMAVSMGSPLPDLKLDADGYCAMCGGAVRLVDPSAPPTWIGTAVQPGDPPAWVHQYVDECAPDANASEEELRAWFDGHARVCLEVPPRPDGFVSTLSRSQGAAIAGLVEQGRHSA